MILTTLRMMELNDFSQKQECSDPDFQRVLSIIGVLILHSGHVFSQLPAHHQLANLKDRKEQLLEMLPERFRKQDFIDLAKSLSIHPRTAERSISPFL